MNEKNFNLTLHTQFLYKHLDTIHTMLYEIAYRFVDLFCVRLPSCSAAQILFDLTLFLFDLLRSYSKEPQQQILCSNSKVRLFL